MRPFHTSILTAALAFVALAGFSRAEDAPAAPAAPAPVATAPAPAPAPPPAPVAGNIPTPARKEETEVTASAEDSGGGIFARFFGTGKKKADPAASQELDAIRHQAESLQAQLTAAQTEAAAFKARLTAVETENATLKAQASAFEAELPAIEAALAAGDSTAPALQTPFGARCASMVLHGITAAHTRAGHDPAKLPGPGSAPPDTGKDQPSAALPLMDPGNPRAAAAGYSAHWKGKGWTPPGLN